MTSATRQHPWTDFFAVAVRPRTYGSLLYLWLGFPLGLAYFVGLTVGISAGLPLTIVWIGLAILVGVAYEARRRRDVPRRAALDIGWVVPPEESLPEAASAEMTGDARGADVTSEEGTELDRRGPPG